MGYPYTSTTNKSIASIVGPYVCTPLGHIKLKGYFKLRYHK